MRCYLTIIAVLALFSVVDFGITASEGRQRRNHIRTDTQQVSQSKRRHDGNRYLTKHRPPTVPDLPPVMETDTFALSYDMSSRQTQCKVIPPQFSMCYNIGYNKMHLPNLKGHDSIDELVKQSNEWTPLLRTRCHPEARKFLCSVFAPVCIPDYPDPIPPCRSLCIAVRDSCSPAMARFDYPWPVMLNCTQFPQEALCISSQATDPLDHQPTTPARVCTACRRKKISRTFKRKLCSFDFIMKTRVKHVTYQSGNIKLTLEKKSRYVMKWHDNINSKSARKIMAKKNVVWMKGSQNCTCDILRGGTRAKYLMAGWQDNGKLRLYSISKWRRSDKRLSKLLKRKRCKVARTKNKRSETLT